LYSGEYSVFWSSGRKAASALPKAVRVVNSECHSGRKPKLMWALYDFDVQHTSLVKVPKFTVSLVDSRFPTRLDARQLGV
jgi:hypothetical protein